MSFHTCCPDKELILKIMTMPTDTNIHGDIFGGWIMSQVDIAGGVLASQTCNGRVSTVAVNHFTFKQPIFVGDLVGFFAKVSRIGNTSMVIDLEVWAQRKRFGDEFVKVTEATVTYVAIDEQRRPRPVLLQA